MQSGAAQVRGICHTTVIGKFRNGQMGYLISISDDIIRHPLFSMGQLKILIADRIQYTGHNTASIHVKVTIIIPRWEHIFNWQRKAPGAVSSERYAYLYIVLPDPEDLRRF